MTPKEYHFAPFRLDVANQCLWRGSAQISLTPKAFSVLLYLAERPDRLVTKQELLDAVWPDIHVTEGVLKRAVLEIRKALADPVDEPRFIQTLHRRGYRFLGSVPDRAAKVESRPIQLGMVGRANELLLLDSWFEDALESSRQVVFITGEPGLGKTTLVDGWMQVLGQRDVAVARGRCLQQFGSGEPYLPVFEALDQLAQKLGRRLVDALRSRAPTWLLHMPALISLEDRARLRDEVFGSSRERMLREITDALEVLSTEVPLVIALEDLHWSDPSTIDLLTSVARRTTPARLMILGTYRTADAARDCAALLAAQNELALHRQCWVMPLDYLSRDETGEYVATRFPDVKSPGPLATALHQRTNGNPLYVVSLVEELARSGGIDSDPETIRDLVPDTLQQMFERQAEQLSAPEQEMLDAAAVAGETFAIAAISAALGSDPGQIESHCEALVKRHVILKRGGTVRYPDGAESPGYAFVHALCRDALARRIAPGRRSRLQGLLGQADEQLYAADPRRAAGELAGRFELAGDFSRAVRYLRMAAEGAAARYSNLEAAGYLERALGMVRRLRVEDQSSLRMDLLEQRGLMRMLSSDMPGAAKDFGELAEEARVTGAVGRQVRALLETVPPLTFVNHHLADAALEKAQVAISGSEEPIVHALVDAYRAFAWMYLHGWDRASADLLFHASETLRRTDDMRIMGRVASMEAAAHTFATDYIEACKSAEESRIYSRRAGAYFDYYVATMFLHWSLLQRGELGRALQLTKEGAELAKKNGSALPLAWLTVRRAWTQMEAFEFAESLATIEKLTADTSISGFRHNVLLFLFQGMALIGLGDYSTARAFLDKVRTAYELGGVAFQGRPLLLHAQTECEVGLGDLDLAAKCAQELTQVASKCHDRSYEARGYRLLADIAIFRGEPEGALQDVSRALAILADCETPIEEWRVHATAARAFAELGRSQEAQRSRQRSLAVADRIAATFDQEPALKESFLRGVSDRLGVRSSSA